MKTAITILFCFWGLIAFSQSDTTVTTPTPLFASVSYNIIAIPEPAYPGGDSALAANFKARIQTPAVFKECEMGAVVRITYYIESTTGKFKYPECFVTFYDKYSYKKSVYIPRCQDAVKDIEVAVKTALDAMPPYPTYPSTYPGTPLPVGFNGEITYEFPIP